jgi:hypothetical protein
MPKCQNRSLRTNRNIAPHPNLKLPPIEKAPEIDHIPLAQKNLQPIQKPTPHLHPRLGPEPTQPSLQINSSAIRFQSAVLGHMPNTGHLRSEWSGVFEGPSASLLGIGPAKTPPAQASSVPALAFFIIRAHPRNPCHPWLIFLWANLRLLI